MEYCIKCRIEIKYTTFVALPKGEHFGRAIFCDCDVHIVRGCCSCFSDILVLREYHLTNEHTAIDIS